MSATATSFTSLLVLSAWSAAPEPRPPQPTSAIFSVSPGDAACAKRSTGSAASAAAPARVLEVCERKVRRVSASEAEMILFMALVFRRPIRAALFNRGTGSGEQRGDLAVQSPVAIDS